MFGNIIYFDQEKVNDYTAIATGQQQLKIDAYNVESDRGVKVDLKAVGADAKAAKSYTAKVLESLLYNCDNFEKVLSGRDDYFDLTESNEYDLAHIPRGNIIKADAYISIPEEFDMAKLISQFRPFLMSELGKGTTDGAELEVLESIFGQDRPAKVPLLIDIEDELFCGKLQEKNLLCTYEDLEDYVETEVTILARISSTKPIKKEKAFYDPLKELFPLNRAFRKSLKDERTEGINEIFADSDYRNIEILAIYQ